MLRVICYLLCFTCHFAYFVWLSLCICMTIKLFWIWIFNVCTYTFLSQNGALSSTCLMHYVICDMDLLMAVLESQSAPTWVMSSCQTASNYDVNQCWLVIRKVQWQTVYPKKYAHGFCFAVLCCGYTLTDFPISIRLTSLALWQSNDCPSASKATLMNMDKYFMWIHYERLRKHNKAKHNKTVCIFLGIYCTCGGHFIGDSPAVNH